MFKHVFWYSLKTFLRGKEGVAFGLFFPLAFSLIYLFVFSGLLTNANSLEIIPVAVVFDGSSMEVASARQILSAVAAPGVVIDGELVGLDDGPLDAESVDVLELTDSAEMVESTEIMESAESGESAILDEPTYSVNSEIAPVMSDSANAVNSDSAETNELADSPATETEPMLDSIQANDPNKTDKAEAEPASIATNSEPLMHYVAATAAEAADLLAENVVAAVVFVDNTDMKLAISLEIAPGAVNHFSSSILYSALSSFTSINLGVQTAYAEVFTSDQPGTRLSKLEQRLSEMNQTQPLTVDANIAKGTSSISLFFYACLAYLCIFFMSIGTNIVTLNEANYSQQALRAAISPMNKMTRFLAAFLSCALPCFAIIYLILFIYYQNGIPLGNDWGRIILLMSVGLLVGLLMGTALASLTKAKESILNTLYVAVPLALGAFSGLMSQELKVFMDTRVPWFNQVNPVSLINDSLFALNNYPSYHQYNRNLLALALIAVLLMAVTLISLRRTDYENL